MKTEEEIREMLRHVTETAKRYKERAEANDGPLRKEMHNTYTMYNDRALMLQWVLGK